MAEKPQTLQCGVDIGGTFTDCAVVDADGRIVVAKAPTTPEDFSVGFLESLGVAARSMGLGLDELLEQTAKLVHGSTIATNTVVEFNGARVGLITTRGHADALPIMRAYGRVAGLPPEMLMRYSESSKPAPLVPRDLIAEVSERVDRDGEVVVELNLDEARAAIASLVSREVEAIAISFLWSFRNGAHELAVKKLIRDEHPDLFVTCSSELAPTWGEYERTVATVINCYVGPKTAAHVSRTQGEVAAAGYERPLLLTQANGGVVKLEDALSAPVLLINSGPAGGLAGCKHLAEISGHRDIVGTDMGGTTFDVGLVVDGEPLIRNSSVIGQYEYTSPVLDIQSVGAGGGSIAWREELSGGLRVGPRSAGSVPGPACYRRGGMEATVTDADLVLGYLNPANFLGGRVEVDVAAAEDAVGRLAEEVELSLFETAAGIVQIVDFQMAELMRAVTVTRGYDPRDFVVLAYGGAGPVHAGGFARELGTTEVVVPLGPAASVWSAYGAVKSDVLHVFERSLLLSAPLDTEAIAAGFAELGKEAEAQLGADGIPAEEQSVARVARMKFALQVHEVEVEVENGDFGEPGMPALVDRFMKRYESLYGAGSGFAGAGVELIQIRLSARGGGDSSAPPAMAGGGEDAGGALAGSRSVYWRGAGAEETPIYDGVLLLVGHRLEGPAIVEMPETTVVVHRGDSLTVDPHGNMVMTLKGGGE
jgi:N-methylhydantoinase A